MRFQGFYVVVCVCVSASGGVQGLLLGVSRFAPKNPQQRRLMHVLPGHTTIGQFVRMMSRLDASELLERAQRIVRLNCGLVANYDSGGIVAAIHTEGTQ